MNEQVFWRIIEASNNAGDLPNNRFRHIENDLSVIAVQDIFKFDKILFWLLDKANFEDLWAAHCVLTNEYSQDNFLRFRYWLIFQGQRIFKKTINDPEYLELFAPEFKSKNIELANYSDFEYLPERVYFNKTELRDYKTANPFSLEHKNINGEKDIDTDTLSDLVPILCKKMGWDTEFYDGKWISDI